VKFLVDAQLPPALARWLREAGHDAQAVREVGLREAHDNDIWRQASATGAILVTKDEDFASRAQQDASGPVVLWLRVGNTSNRALRAWFLPQLPQILALIQQGVRLVEVR
jgi:predicted nuclease of predicted toxin-antitoxin system